MIDDDELLAASPGREIDWGNVPNGGNYDPDEEGGIDVIEDGDDWEWGTI